MIHTCYYVWTQVASEISTLDLMLARRVPYPPNHHPSSSFALFYELSWIFWFLDAIYDFESLDFLCCLSPAWSFRLDACVPVHHNDWSIHYYQ